MGDNLDALARCHPLPLTWRWSPGSNRMQGNSSYALSVMRLWVLHTPQSSVQVPSVSMWSWNGFSGSRSLEENDNTECRSAGSHTSPCSAVQEPRLCGFFLKNLQTFRPEEKTLEPLVSYCFQCLADTLFLGSCSAFFHCWIHLVWLLPQNLPTGINTHLSYL